MPAADDGVLLTRGLAIELREMVRQWKAGRATPAVPLSFDRGGTRLLLAKTTVVHPQGESHTVQVFTGDAPSGDEKGDETEAGDRTFEAYNRAFGTLDEDTWILVARIGGTGCEIVQAFGHCPEVHGIAIMGSAQGGTMDLAYTLGGESGTVSIGNTFSAAEVLSAFEGHPGVTEGDVIVVGGPLPSPVFVRFAGELTGQVIDLPVIENNLDGNPQADPWVWWASTVDWRQAVSVS